MDMSGFPPLPPEFRRKERDDYESKKNASPEELIAFYESKGLDTHAASLKVISDLQRAMYRITKPGKRSEDSKVGSHEFKAFNTRLAIFDIKLNSKPGYRETFAIGIASGATLKGVSYIIPHVFNAFRQIWSSVCNAKRIAGSGI